MIIDFDSKFREYLENWMITNASKYANTEEMEVEALDIYAKWLNTPAEWLDGVAPNKYFSSYKDAHKLTDMLVEYLNTKVGVPDLLLDAIAGYGEKIKESLTKLFRLEYKIDESNHEEAIMLAINLLAELDDKFLFDDYIKLLLDKSTKEEVANIIIERLEFADKAVVDKILDGLKSIDDEEVETRCMDILVNFPGDERIYSKLTSMFNQYTNTALLAAYLGKYGDDRAVGILQESLNWEDINYLDYIEIRHAIEELGKEVDHIRTFDGDSYYESLKHID